MSDSFRWSVRPAAAVVGAGGSGKKHREHRPPGGRAHRFGGRDGQAQPCHELFARGRKAIEVIGPVPEVEQEIAALHRDFWRSA